MAPISLLYAPGLLGWHSTRFTRLGSWWPFELVDVFGVWLYLPLPLLLLLTAAWRRWWAGTWLMVPLLVFGWEYGALFLPQRGLDGGIPLRVITANLLVSNDDAAAFSAALAEIRPDLIAVQELNEAMAADLADALWTAYPHQVLDPSEAPFGMGLFSRYPLHSGPPVQVGSDICFCQEVRIDLSGRWMTMLNIHPSPPAVGYRRVGQFSLPTSFSTSEPERILRAVLERAGTIQEPLVVLGDFNISDRQPLYRLISRQLRDAHREGGSGFGYTFPNRPFEGLLPFPLVRIDYVFHDASWVTRASWTGALAASDHRYVVADLLLR